jgi:hypothetical protein
MATSRPNPRVLVPAIAFQLVIGTLTVRDIRNRSSELIRGPKWLWALWGGTNTLGAAVYWLIGRKRRA